MREGNKGKRPNPNHATVCLDLFLARAWVRLLLLVLAFVFLIPRRLTVFGGWARLSILVLYGTYRAHDQRAKSAVSAKRAYWTDGGRCSMIVLDECGSLS
jgi:hypothetical protein